MTMNSRNYLTGRGLLPGTAPERLRVLGMLFFDLRSLPILKGSVAIPRRFSSSSLPPSFASGRFAGFCFSGRRAAGC
jgi:hypothetical protein